MSRSRLRAAVVGIATGTLVLTLASPAFAAGPTHERIDAAPVQFDAGQACPFAVEWTFKTKGLMLTTFSVQANGDQLVRQTGHVVATITNLESGKSITTNTSDRQDFLFHADGTIEVTITGHALAAYFPTDLGGPAMSLYDGHLHDIVDSSF